MSNEMRSTPRPGDPGTGEDQHGTGQGPHDTGHGPLPWVLVAAAAAPVALAADASRRFFAGELDFRYFGYDPATDLTPGVPSVSFVDRWAAFGYAVPAAPAVLASALGVVVVTGLVLLGRPQWLVPGRVSRWAASAVAGANALASLLLVAGALVAAGTDPVTTSSGGSSATVGYTEIVGDLGVGLLTGVVCALACVVLARPPARPVPGPLPGPAPDEQVEAPGAPTGVAPLDATPGGSTPGGPTPGGPTPDGATPGGATPGGGNPGDAGPGLPRASADDLARYRRP